MTRRTLPVLGVALLVGANVVARTVAARALDAPWIAPDEFVYSLIGRTFWSTGGLTLFEGKTPFYGLYPLLTGAPLVLFGQARGLAVMQVTQVLVASLTIVVVYAWARRMTSTGWALAAAGMTAALPALAYTGLLMTESVFLVLVSLALWALARALVEPTIGRQAVMLAVILMAFMIRLQAVVFVPTVLLAVVVRALCARDARVIRRLVPALAVLGVATAIGLLVRSAGSGSPLGAYETAAQGDYDLGAALTWIGWHVADVSLLVVTVPVFAALLLLVQSIRGEEDDPDVQALLAVAISYGIVSVALVGVFASTYVGQLAERDLISVAPPLFVAFAVWLGRGLPRPQPTALFVAFLLATPMVLLPVRDLVTPAATPDALMLVPLLKIEEATSASTLELVWLIAVCALVALAALVPRRGAPALAALVVVTLAVTSVIAQRELDDRTHVDRAEVFGSSNPDWIDRNAPGRVAYLYANDPLWTGVWQIAFWNENVASVVAISGERSYGPVPGSTDADILEDGTLVTDGRRLRGGQAVVSPANIYVDGKRLASSRQAPDQAGLVLWEATDPLRLMLRVTRLPPERVTKDPFTVEVFGCDGGTLNVGFLARHNTTIGISVDAGGQSTLDVPGGKTVDATVRLPRQTDRRLCLVRFSPQGEVVVGGIRRSVPERGTGWAPEVVASLRTVDLPDLRAGYCLDGAFLNLAFRQPEYDRSMRAAVPANFVEGIGLTCDPPPPGYVRRGFAPATLGVVPNVNPYYSAR